jgi:hypothetical protein
MVLCGLGVAAFLLYSGGGGWFPELGEWPGARRELEEAERRSAELTEQAQGGVARLWAKERVAEEVIAGRLTLRQAAARYRHLARAHPGFFWKQYREAYPGPTDWERHCQEVLALVRHRLRDRPDQARAVLDRLGAEWPAALDERDLVPARVVRCE